MAKTIYKPEYVQLINFLKAAREGQGLTQASLGMLIGQDQSYVCKYEKQIRRLDIIEIIDICDTLNISTNEFNELINNLRKYQP